VSKTCADMARDLGSWPMCSTPDCANRVNHWLKRGKCYPCSLADFGLDRAWFENKLKSGTRPWDAESELLLADLERKCAGAA